VQTQCALGLAHGLSLARPNAVIDSRGYVRNAEENLVHGIRLANFERDLRGGAGSELEGKFLAAHSSCALVVNCFAWFRARDVLFNIGRHRGLRLIGFEQKCPTGLARAQRPNLDLLATGPSGLVAIESKCLEYLSPKVAKFSKRYETKITDERASGPWFAEMLRLTAGGRGYRLLDAAQLIKHAFGVAKRTEGPTMTLIYLYWEPLDNGQSPLFAQHRDEIAEFFTRVSGGNPSFESLRYRELWDAWAAWAASGNADLMAHVKALRSRYEVPAWGLARSRHAGTERAGSPASRSRR
jgi:hypothetical protein